MEKDGFTKGQTPIDKGLEVVQCAACGDIIEVREWEAPDVETGMKNALNPHIEKSKSKKHQVDPETGAVKCLK